METPEADAPQSAGFELPQREQPLSRRYLWIVVLVVAIGAVLRLLDLGRIGLDRNNDEDIMAIAVLGILEHGYPLMPSGMIYFRSAPLLYLMAGSAHLFGISEFGLRIVPALCGIALLPLVFYVARRYFGNRVALLATTLAALSLWHVEVARLARMYAPFGFLYLLTLYAICRGFLDGIRGWRLASIPLAALTIPVHALGFTLAFAFALAALLPVATRELRATAVIGALVTVSTYVYWDRLQSQGFDRALALAAASEPQQLTQRAAIEQGFIAAALDRLYVPPPLSVAPMARIAVAVLLVSAMIGVCVWLWRRRPELRAPHIALLIVTVLIAALAHQFLLTGILFGVLVAFRPEGRPTWLWPVMTFLIAAGLVWLGVGVLAGDQRDGSLRPVLQALLDYPRLEVLRPFVQDRPLITLLAAIGSYVTARDAVRRRRVTAPAFLLVAGIAALLLHGVFESDFRTRYNFNVDALFLMFTATGIVFCSDWALARWQANSSQRRWGSRDWHSGLAIGLLAAAALFDLRTPSAFAYPAYWEGTPRDQLARWGFQARFDRRSTAVYVAEHKAPEDEVMSMDWFTTYFYAGRADYLLRSGKFDWVVYRRGGRDRDAYLGSIIVPGTAELERRLSDPCEPTVWLVTSASALGSRRKTSAEVEHYVRELEEHRVYTGLDGNSAVYRFEPEGVCTPSAAR